MKKLGFVFAGMMASGPALAHDGAALHMHPHDGASWLAICAALAVIAVSGGVAFVSRRARK